MTEAIPQFMGVRIKRREDPALIMGQARYVADIQVEGALHTAKVRHRTETPTPLNPLGVKGVRKAATIGSTPAVVNAVVDALAPFGVRHLDMPLTPERVLHAIHRNGRS